MSDIVLNLGQSVPSNLNFRYRDMGDGTHALVYAIGGTVVATIAVPAVDSAANALIQDVVGNKLDTVGGNSLVALIRQIMADLIVPGADSGLNINWGDVIGNKLDTASDDVAASVVALLREILEDVVETDQHFHNTERWWGAVQAPDETNAIDANVNSDFVAASGANTWGAAIPILGTADDPTPNGQTTFDAHRVLFTDLDGDTSLWRFRIIYGYGTSGDAITADQWTEIPVITNAIPGNRAGGTASNIKMFPLPVGIKLWAQAWNDTDEEELSFQWGCHGYPAPAAPTPP